MFAVIRQPVPDVIQSGPRGSEEWKLEFPRTKPLEIDPLTGNIGSKDVLHEVDLSFETREQAIAYAKANNIPYRLIEKPKHKPVGRSYGDNFAFERKFPWTH